MLLRCAEKGFQGKGSVEQWSSGDSQEGSTSTGEWLQCIGHALTILIPLFEFLPSPSMPNTPKKHCPASHTVACCETLVACCCETLVACCCVRPVACCEPPKESESRVHAITEGASQFYVLLQNTIYTVCKSNSFSFLKSTLPTHSGGDSQNRNASQVTSTHMQGVITTFLCIWLSYLLVDFLFSKPCLNYIQLLGNLIRVSTVSTVLNPKVPCLSLSMLSMLSFSLSRSLCQRGLLGMLQMAFELILNSVV